MNNSLEFAHYKAKFERKLGESGYTVVQNSEAAQYIALVAYGIDSGKTKVVSTPIFGQTGGVRRIIQVPFMDQAVVPQHIQAVVTQCQHMG